MICSGGLTAGAGGAAAGGAGGAGCGAAGAAPGRNLRREQGGAACAVIAGGFSAGASGAESLVGCSLIAAGAGRMMVARGGSSALGSGRGWSGRLRRCCLGSLRGLQGCRRGGSGRRRDHELVDNRLYAVGLAGNALHGRFLELSADRPGECHCAFVRSHVDVARFQYGVVKELGLDLCGGGFVVGRLAELQVPRTRQREVRWRSRYNQSRISASACSPSACLPSSDPTVAASLFLDSSSPT